jgi:ADP-heptose:LPS heptosyltransferase
VQRRILFVHTHGGIGDLLLSAPIAEAIGRAWPDATVTPWVHPAYQGLLARNPCFGDCLSVEGRSFGSQCRALRRAHFDVAILPWTTARQTALVWLARIPIRVGQAGRLAYSWMFTVPVVISAAHGDTSRHWMDIQLDYARALGFATEGVKPRLFLDNDEVVAARRLLAQHGVDPGAHPFGLHIGKGIPLTPERWPVGGFVEVGRRIAAGGHHVVLIGSPQERAVASQVAGAIGAGATVVTSESVRDLAALIANLSVVVTPDSGPGHIAAALDVPVVSIFAVKSGPIARWRPWTPAHRVVTTAPWACPKKCVKEKCPRFDCLEAFDPAKVVEAAFELTEARVRA